MTYTYKLDKETIQHLINIWGLISETNSNETYDYFDNLCNQTLKQKLGFPSNLNLSLGIISGTLEENNDYEFIETEDETIFNKLLSQSYLPMNGETNDPSYPTEWGVCKTLN